MKTTLEPLEGNKVKVSVEVDEAEFDKAVDAAFRKISREVRIKGFRPGKAPRRVLEQYVLPEYVREQALRDAIPEFLAQAVRDNDVDIIAPPEIDITSGQEEGPVAFDATIEVRPTVIVPGYGGLRVELPRIAPTDEELDEQVDRIRRPHGAINDVDRPAARGDFVLIDLWGGRDGEPLSGLDVSDFSYEVGSDRIAPGFDEELIGATAGDALAFTTDHPVPSQEPIEFRVAVKAVREQVLPELTDAWVGENTEHGSIEELRADLRRRVTTVRAIQVQMALRDRVVSALADLVDDEPPEALVNNDLQERAQGFVNELARQGIGLEQYLEATDRTAQDVSEELRAASVSAVKADLGLRAVADAESIDVDDDAVDAEIERIATRSRQKPNQVRKAYERQDAIGMLKAELRKRRALDWLVDHCEIVDPDGHPIDRADLMPRPADADRAAPASSEEDTPE